jgi:hypothetical protein
MVVHTYNPALGREQRQEAHEVKVSLPYIVGPLQRRKKGREGGRKEGEGREGRERKKEKENAR